MIVDIERGTCGKKNGGGFEAHDAKRNTSDGELRELHPAAILHDEALTGLSAGEVIVESCT